jgi:hypothetical protein
MTSRKVLGGPMDFGYSGRDFAIEAIIALSRSTCIQAVDVELRNAPERVREVLKLWQESRDLGHQGVDRNGRCIRFDSSALFLFRFEFVKDKEYYGGVVCIGDGGEFVGEDSEYVDRS